MDVDEEHFSDEDSSSSSDREDEHDQLMTDGFDIPRVDNIPIVSKIAKEKQLEQKQTKSQVTREKVKELMQKDHEEYESHFVENPFIRMRERSKLKGQVKLGAAQLNTVGDEEDEKMQDIVIVKESGKFIINDPEDIMDKKKKPK